MVFLIVVKLKVVLLVHGYLQGGVMHFN